MSRQALKSSRAGVTLSHLCLHLHGAQSSSGAHLLFAEQVRPLQQGPAPSFPGEIRRWLSSLPSTGDGFRLSRGCCSCLWGAELEFQSPAPLPPPMPVCLTIFKLRGLNELPAMTHLQHSPFSLMNLGELSGLPCYLTTTPVRRPALGCCPSSPDSAHGDLPCSVPPNSVGGDNTGFQAPPSFHAVLCPFFPPILPQAQKKQN